MQGADDNTSVSYHPAKGHEKFFNDVIFTCPYPVYQAMLHVMLQNQQRGLGKGRSCSRYLGKNIITVGIFGHHPPYAPRLTFNACQAGIQNTFQFFRPFSFPAAGGTRFLVIIHDQVLLKRFKRSALVTTETLDSDMAAAANMGFNSGPPKRNNTPAATGIPRTL
jgi:hypothetical protein